MKLLRSEHFDIQSLGTKGSFSAIFVALLSCVLYRRIKKNTWFTLRRHTMGMESMCASAVSAFIPMIFVVAIVMFINYLLYVLFGVYNINELFGGMARSLFDNMSNNFGSGILYTFMLHLLWIVGFHGSHILEPVQM